MMSIVRRSPFFDVPTHVEVRGQSVLVRPFQLVVWVSLQARGRSSPPLPAILDTGFSLNFSIQEEQLRSWAGLSPEDFRVMGRSRINHQDLRLYDANVAVHPNAAGQRDVFRGEARVNCHFAKGSLSIHAAIRSGRGCHYWVCEH